MGDNLVPIGLSRGCKIFGSKSPILIEEADGAKTARFSRGHSWHGHYRSARCFRRQSRAPRGAPLRARGLTAQRGRAKGGCHAKNARKAPRY